MNEIISWTNDNSGFLTLIVFLATLFAGWISGIFQRLRFRPNFELDIIAGPTFCSIFHTGRKFENFENHKTAISVYLRITNTGTAPSEIQDIQVGYHNHTFKYTFFWFWLKSTVALRDFGHTIGENLRVYPFLLQKSILLPRENITYLKSGQSSNGIVYFEQVESFGGFQPRIKNEKIKIKIKVFDVYKKSYSKSFWIPKVDLTYAKKFNEEFGQTLEKMGASEIEEWKIF